MPLFRIGHDLHYFAHVPKCGGTSVERYLSDRFGTLGFLHPGDPGIEPEQRWWRASAQHIPASEFFRLIPREWVLSSFAVVRNPVHRVISAFNFSRDVQQLVPASWSIDDYLAHWLKVRDHTPFAYDGHLRPQASFVPEDATVFRLEGGLDQVVDHLDRLSGSTSGPRHIERVNSAVASDRAARPRMALSRSTVERIVTMYAEDFARFGYALPSDGDVFPDVPGPEPSGPAHPPQRPGGKVRLLMSKLGRSRNPVRE